YFLRDTSARINHLALQHIRCPIYSSVHADKDGKNEKPQNAGVQSGQTSCKCNEGQNTDANACYHSFLAAVHELTCRIRRHQSGNYLRELVEYDDAHECFGEIAGKRIEKFKAKNPSKNRCSCQRCARQKSVRSKRSQSARTRNHYISMP